MGGPGSGRKKLPQSEFTTATANEIIKLVAQGNYFETAVAAVGAPINYARRWLREGARAKRGAKRDFWVGVKRAEAQAESQAVTAIRFHGSKTWQALAWYLERKHPKRWGKRDFKIEKAGMKNGEPVFKFVLGDDGK